MFSITIFFKNPGNRGFAAESNVSRPDPHRLLQGLTPIAYFYFFLSDHFFFAISQMEW